MDYCLKLPRLQAWLILGISAALWGPNSRGDVKRPHSPVLSGNTAITGIVPFSPKRVAQPFVVRSHIVIG